MTREQAFEKIRKLLQTSGRTDAEADTAQILAACLAEKHGIDLAEVDNVGNPDLVKLTHRTVGEWARVPDEGVYASLICQRFFEIKALETHRLFMAQMVFIGTEQHITIAEYVFEFLRGEFSRAWNRRRNKRIKARKRFIYGCYIGLLQKLAARFEKSDASSTALVVSLAAKREAYLKENFGETKTNSVAPKNVNGKAASVGFQAGKEIDIRDGVAAGQQPVGALGAGPKQLGWA